MRNKILKFLKEKDALKPCDACGKSLWQVPSDNVNRALPLTCNLPIEMGNLAAETQVAVMPTVVAVCMNCAHIRFFSANGIRVVEENE